MWWFTYIDCLSPLNYSIPSLLLLSLFHRKLKHREMRWGSQGSKCQDCTERKRPGWGLKLHCLSPELLVLAIVLLFFPWGTEVIHTFLLSVFAQDFFFLKVLLRVFPAKVKLNCHLLCKVLPNSSLLHCSFVFLSHDIDCSVLLSLDTHLSPLKYVHSLRKDILWFSNIFMFVVTGEGMVPSKDSYCIGHLWMKMFRDSCT